MRVPVLHTHLAASSYQQMLRKQGARFIDGGVYAKVYLHPRDANRVIKVGRTLADPYLDYVFLITPDNPYFPRIYATAICQPSPGGSQFEPYYVVEMEKLRPLFSLPRTQVDTLFSRMGFAQYTGGNRKTLLLPFHEWEAFKARKTWQGEAALEALLKMLKRYLERNRDADLDIHEKNLMWRLGRPPQLVVTDPLSLVHMLTKSGVKPLPSGMGI